MACFRPLTLLANAPIDGYGAAYLMGADLGHVTGPGWPPIRHEARVALSDTDFSRRAESVGHRVVRCCGRVGAAR